MLAYQETFHNVTFFQNLIPIQVKLMNFRLELVSAGHLISTSVCSWKKQTFRRASYTPIMNIAVGN
jgi:hypothetical protein